MHMKNQTHAWDLIISIIKLSIGYFFGGGEIKKLIEE